MSEEKQYRLAFSGAKYSGKSTSVDYLKSKINDLEEVSFALPLKEVCSNLFDIELNIFQDPVLKETILDGYDVTPRELLIAVGDLLRFELPKKLPKLKLKRNVLTDKAQRHIKSLKDGNKSIGVSDCRDPNFEKSMLKEEGFTTIEIKRPDEQRGGQTITHWTESGFGDVDITIHNDVDKATLYKKIDLLL